MKWIGISGTWQNTNKKVEEDVRRTVKKILDEENGIVTGGALGVDYYATDEAMKKNPDCTKIKVFLPTTIHRYVTHYKKRAKEGVITSKQAEMLIEQLTTLKRKNFDSLIENKKNTLVERTTYFERNSNIIEIADELFAFQVNNSKGVQDTIDKAQRKGIHVTLFTYTF